MAEEKGMERGLVIRERWLNLILEGKKTWEMRSEKTNIRGPIALIEKGSGLVVGIARLIDSLAPLSRENYMKHLDKHAIPEDVLAEVMTSGWVYPWVFSDARRLPAAVPYKHKPGAVTFVRLENSVSAAIDQQSAAPSPKPEPAVLPKAETPARVSMPQVAAKSPSTVVNSPTSATLTRPTSGVKRYCFRPELAQAWGYPRAGGKFLVELGSTAMREGSPRVKRDRLVREQLVQRGILVPDSNARLYRFAADYEFSSPSQAAGVVKDGNASGKGLWIDETTGKSLRDDAT